MLNLSHPFSLSHSDEALTSNASVLKQCIIDCTYILLDPVRQLDGRLLDVSGTFFRTTLEPAADTRPSPQTMVDGWIRTSGHGLIGEDFVRMCF